MKSFDEIFGPMPPHSLWELEILGDHLFTVAVSYSFPEEFKKMVFAAAKTYVLGNSSVDYVLKRYGKVWDFQSSKQPFYSLYLSLCETVDEHVMSEIRRFSEISEKQDHHGLFASGAALLRLQVSFDLACLLLREGLWLELACVEKLILEQIGWVYVVRNLQGTDLFNSLPSKSIKKLQEVFPNAGRLYGWLNENAHVNPEKTINYLDFSTKRPQVFLSSSKQAVSGAYFLLLLADMYQVCSEIVHIDYYNAFSSIKVKAGKFAGLKSRRPFVKVVSSFRKKLMRVSSGK